MSQSVRSLVALHVVHELAHLLRKHEAGEVNVDRVLAFCRDVPAASGKVEDEAEANHSAVGLLTPKALLRHDRSELVAYDVITNDNLEGSAERREVSIMAMMYRLIDPDLLSRDSGDDFALES